MRKVTDSEIKEIIHLYACNGVSINKLRKMFKLQFRDVKEILLREGIKVRSHRESRKTYVYDEDYFEVINTPEKSYWLGFIYADGFITKKTNGSPVFGISLRDKEPLEQLNKCLRSNKPIGVYNKTNSYSSTSIEYKLAFCSSKMVSDLEKWGCIENKTFSLKFPTFLDNNLIPHFIRGYFDGDGSVFLHVCHTKNTEYIMLGSAFSGIKSFLQELAKHIEATSCLYKDKRKTTDCYTIQLISNIRSLKLYHYMYKNANGLYLKRKKDKFDNFIKDRSSTTTISNPIYGEAPYKELCYIED